MKIYIGHSNQMNYKEELYMPIINSTLYKEHEIIFPYLNNNDFDTKKVIAESDLFIADVSKPSLGLGIEIGRAESIGKKILCIYNKKEKCSSSIKYINADIIEYSDKEDLINKIKEYIDRNSNE